MALGLILSSSDFNVMYTGPTAPASNFIGGENGTAGLNSSLSNPITSSGEFNRTFAISSTNNLDAYSVHLISSSVDSSLYSGSISTSKAYSMRAWIRGTKITPASGMNVFGSGLVFMTQDNAFFDGGINVYTTRLAGYTLQLSGRRQNNTDFDTGKQGLIIGANRVSGTAGVATDCTGPNHGGTTDAYAPDTWYRVRFDMVPVGSAGVTLNAYTSSAGDVQSGQETWVLVGTQFVDAIDPYYIDPILPKNAMGFYAWADNAIASSEPTSHFDQFEILVQDL